uniref:O-methyltransferase n=1 Tax=Trichobilharzia regenti TaxID=157069 RepID=A0AA85KLT7_TRIRE|nr:unnamed protein product [Trichobilharzia regenti]
MTDLSRFKLKSITDKYGCTKIMTKIDQYIIEHSLRLSEAQKWLLQKTKQHPRASRLISSLEMQFMSNICYAINAKKTLVIGTLTGYAPLSLAEVLPSDGSVLALETTDEYLKDYCIPAWRQAGVESKIDFRHGSVIEILENLIANGESETFDFALIDGEKNEYVQHYELCLKLIQPRGIIAIDNVIWSELVIDESDQTDLTIGIRQLNDLIAKDDRVKISLLNIGDGLTVVVKN